MSPRLPPCTPRRVLRVLKRAGFFIHETTGSHHILKHPERHGLRVTVAYHNKDLKRKTLASIIEQTGMTIDEFLQLL